MTKAQLCAAMAQLVGITKKQCADFFDNLIGLVRKEMQDNASGEFTIPGIVKFWRYHRPAQAAGMRPNPFRPGQMMEVKEKPARSVIKARPLKILSKTTV